MSVEVAALGAGKSVAKIVVSRWLAGRASKQAESAELIDMLKTGVPDELMRRKAENKFEDLALSVAERLRPYTRQELRGLNDGTREAALQEVVRTLGTSDLSDAALLADDMDPVRIARRVRAVLPRREAELQLGEAGARLYEVLLAECCDCLAHTLVHLPEFTERAAAESLSRLSSVVSSLETILARLPARTLDAPDGDSLDDEFTRRYLTSVAANLDQLELFGIRLEQFTRPRTTLSVAHISLNVTEEAPDHAKVPGQAPVTIAEWQEDRRGRGTVRVERALGEHRLMLIRGEAGGGKSTLLRWLAISAARGTFIDDLAPLNGYVPFLVKLRSHAGQRMPRPEELLDDVAPELSGVMPDAWSHRRLRSGRALLMVDGIDEIVGPQRHQVREWLGRFAREYPAVRIVVTSRPPAAEADWLRAEGFRSAFLEPLSPADLRELVKHWHLAIRDSDDLPCPAERLPSYEARLLARLESAPHLRTLASTPLLAAMLCALNLDRRNALPRDRMGVYAAAIDMLLETRDAGREIPSAQTVRLERDQKIQILRELAWHLSTSDRVELPVSTAQRLAARQVEAMPQVRVSGEEALEALVQRSGIIREPIPGRIDFVHRTIGEYLTAEHATDIGDMDLLIRNAHLDQWRETTIMAAGHANTPQRNELIEGILGRAKREEKICRRLQFLAAACLETLPAVSAGLRTALDQCLCELIPPNDYHEASLLASIGDPVLRMLPESLGELSDEAACASVRTAYLINGPWSLNVLRRYAADSRNTVQYEIGKAWNYFAHDEYADRVLTAMPPGGDLHVSSVDQLVLLKKLTGLAHLTINLTRSADLANLPSLPNLQTLGINVPEILDINFLNTLPPLSSISLDDCKSLSDYSPLQRSTALDALALRGSSQLRSLDQLPPLGKVRILFLTGSKLDHGALAALVSTAPRIHYLHLDNCDWVDDLTPLTALPNLEYLSIRQIAPGVDLSPLTQNRNLGIVAIAPGQDVRAGGSLGNRLDTN